VNGRYRDPRAREIFHFKVMLAARLGRPRAATREAAAFGWPITDRAISFVGFGAAVVGIDTLNRHADSTDIA